MIKCHQTDLHNSECDRCMPLTAGTQWQNLQRINSAKEKQRRLFFGSVAFRRLDYSEKMSTDFRGGVNDKILVAIWILLWITVHDYND